MEEELELTWARFGKLAWLFCWRFVVLGAVGGILATYLLSLFGNPGPPGIAAIVWIPIVLLCLRMMLRKRYQDFRVALISTSTPTRTCSSPTAGAR